MIVGMGLKKRWVGWLMACIIVAAAVYFVHAELKRLSEPRQIPSYRADAGIQLSIPPTSAVQSLQMNLNSPHQNSYALQPDSAVHRAVISNLVHWLRTAKPLGIETNHPVPTIGPTAVEIQLSSHQTLEVEQALDVTESRRGSWQRG